MDSPQILMDIKASFALGTAQGSISLARKALQEMEGSLKYIPLRNTTDREQCAEIDQALFKMIDDLATYEAQIGKMRLNIENCAINNGLK